MFSSVWIRIQVIKENLTTLGTVFLIKEARMLIIPANEINFTIKVALYFPKEKKSISENLNKRPSLFRFFKMLTKPEFHPKKFPALFFFNPPFAQLPS
jgi:hypothetical protein